MLGKNSADDSLKYFFLIFLRQQALTFSCKLSHKETICMKCQSLSKPVFWEISEKHHQSVICRNAEHVVGLILKALSKTVADSILLLFFLP